MSRRLFFSLSPTLACPSSRLGLFSTVSGDGADSPCELDCCGAGFPPPRRHLSSPLLAKLCQGWVLLNRCAVRKGGFLLSGDQATLGAAAYWASWGPRVLFLLPRDRLARSPCSRTRSIAGGPTIASMGGVGAGEEGGTGLARARFDWRAITSGRTLLPPAANSQLTSVLRRSLIKT